MTASNPLLRFFTGAMASAMLVAVLVGCAGGANEEAVNPANGSEGDITMAEWAPETDVEAGELVTTFDADGVTVEVYQVAVIPSPIESGRDLDGDPIVQEGDDVAVLNLVFTNTGDPLDITYISAEPLAYTNEEPLDVESLSLSEEALAHTLTDLGLNPDWTTVDLVDDETVTFKSGTRAARALVIEYVPEADLFMKVHFSRPTVAEEAELITTQ